MDKQQRIFISYSRINEAFTIKLAQELKNEGFSAWLDQLDIPPGARWDEEVEKALRQCDIFMLIMTPTSVASENVKDEIGYALGKNKRLIPIMLEKCEIPFRLHRFQYVDFTKKSFDDGVLSVSNLLRSLIAQPTISNKEVPDNTQDEVTQPVAATEVDENGNKTAAQEAEDERKAIEEADRIAAKKSEEERLTKATEEAKRYWKEEAAWMAAQRAKTEPERKAKEEAERIEAQKAEEERAAKARAEAERHWKEEADWMAAQKAKTEATRKAKEEAERIEAQKAEEERAAKARTEAERQARENTYQRAGQKVEEETRRSAGEKQKQADAKVETRRPKPEASWMQGRWKWALGGFVFGLILLAIDPNPEGSSTLTKVLVILAITACGFFFRI
jgi:hypothetical protein